MPCPYKTPLLRGCRGRYLSSMPRISSEEALNLFETATLDDLKTKASLAKARFFEPKSATYIVMRIVSYTNICVADCSYCAFYRKPGDTQGYVLTLDQIYEKADALVAQGGTLIAMEGGFNPELKLDHYEKLVRSLRARYGDKIEIYGPTAVELLFIARTSKVSVDEALSRLAKAGLRWIPGGGAEILTNAWRKKLSPKKYSVEQYFEVMRAATRAGFGTTSTMVIGFGENFADRVAHLERVREHQDQTGGFASFLLWTYQSQNTALGGSVTTNEDYLRTLAIARLYLDNIEHVRASFLTQGERGPEALLYGANDFDIVLEDQVTEMAGVNLQKKTETVLNWVKGAGITAVKRPYFAVTPNKKAFVANA